MIASALQILGLAMVSIALALWVPLVGLVVAGLSIFAIGFILEAK